MKPPAQILSVECDVVNATRRTNWVFVRVRTGDGLVGVGEATLDGHESQVRSEVAACAEALVGEPAQPNIAALRPHPAAFGGLAHAAASSAIDQALWDLAGKRADLSVADLFGGPRADSVRLYANVNRSLLADRSADAFAVAAAAAAADGFDAVKVAPFDGVLWQPREDRRGGLLISEGVERVRAVRAAVGSQVDVLIDCHFRFGWRTALSVIAELAELDPYWIEAPVPERDIEGWQQVRAGTDVRLAGGEFLVGLEEHRRFLQATGVDVILADVKYCGGLGTLRHTAALAESFGVELAPHNPSGPVAMAASAQVALVAPNVPLLEFGWGEVDWRPDLVHGRERIETGRLQAPAGAGIGVELDDEVIRSHPEVPMTKRSDLWSR